MYRTRLFLLTTAIIIVICSFFALIIANPNVVRSESKAPPPFTASAGVALMIPGQDVSEPDDAKKLILSAPDTMEVGELVRLSLEGSDAGGFKWQIKPHTNDFEVFQDGWRAHLTARPDSPESFLLMISGAGKVDSEDAGQSYLVWKEIHVEGRDVDEGPRTLAHSVERWAKMVKPYEGRQVHLKQIANVFTEIAADKQITAEEMETAVAIASTAVLGQDLIAVDGEWAPFLDKLGAKIDELKADGELDAREQFEAVWLEISRGLERAAR